MAAAAITEMLTRPEPIHIRIHIVGKRGSGKSLLLERLCSRFGSDIVAIEHQCLFMSRDMILTEGRLFVLFYDDNLLHICNLMRVSTEHAQKIRQGMSMLCDDSVMGCSRLGHRAFLYNPSSNTCTPVEEDLFWSRNRQMWIGLVMRYANKDSS